MTALLAAGYILHALAAQFMAFVYWVKWQETGKTWRLINSIIWESIVAAIIILAAYYTRN